MFSHLIALEINTICEPQDIKMVTIGQTNLQWNWISNLGIVFSEFIQIPTQMRYALVINNSLGKLWYSYQNYRYTYFFKLCFLDSLTILQYSTFSYANFITALSFCTYCLKIYCPQYAINLLKVGFSFGHIWHVKVLQANLHFKENH